MGQKISFPTNDNFISQRAINTQANANNTVTIIIKYSETQYFNRFNYL